MVSRLTCFSTRMVIISRTSWNSRMSRSAFGATPIEALNELKTAWELMKECYQMDGELIPKAPSRHKYEGPFNVPVDAQLYHFLTDEAAKAGMSLYTLVTQRLKPTQQKQAPNHKIKEVVWVKTDTLKTSARTHQCYRSSHFGRFAI